MRRLIFLLEFDFFLRKGKNQILIKKLNYEESIIDMNTSASDIFQVSYLNDTIHKIKYSIYELTPINERKYELNIINTITKCIETPLMTLEAINDKIYITSYLYNDLGKLVKDFEIEFSKSFKIISHKLFDIDDQKKIWFSVKVCETIKNYSKL